MNTNSFDNTDSPHSGINKPTPLYNFVSTLSDAANTESSIVRNKTISVLASTTESIKLQTFQSVQSEPTRTKLPTVLTTITTAKPTKSSVIKSTKRPVSANSSLVTHQSVSTTTRKPTKSKPTHVTKGPIISHKKTTNTFVRTTKRPPTPPTITTAAANKLGPNNNTTIITTVKPVLENAKFTTFSTVTSESTTSMPSHSKNSTNSPTTIITTTTAPLPTTTTSPSPLITISFVETTRVPKPKPKPTSQIVSIPPTNLDYLNSEPVQTTSPIWTSTSQQMTAVASNESSTISIEHNSQTEMTFTTGNEAEIKESVNTLIKNDEPIFQSSPLPSINNNATEMPELITWTNFIDNQTELNVTNIDETTTQNDFTVSTVNGGNGSEVSLLDSTTDTILSLHTFGKLRRN